MNTDEQAILDYIKGWPTVFVSGKEIARKVGGKARFEKDRNWAVPILAQMVRMNILEVDSSGGYKLREQEEDKHKVTHVSPQLLKILKSSGKSFEGLELAEDDEPPIPAYRKPG